MWRQPSRLRIVGPGAEKGQGLKPHSRLHLEDLSEMRVPCQLGDRKQKSESFVVTLTETASPAGVLRESSFLIFLEVCQMSVSNVHGLIDTGRRR